jgi:hypothetical protein
MNQPPAQQSTCANCGQPIPTSTSYCAHCGHGMHPTRRLATTQQVLVSLLLALVGIPAILCGGCFLVFAPASASPEPWLLGLGGVIIGVLIVWLFVRVQRGNRNR